MINVIVCGATGRMGTRLIERIDNTEGMRITGAITSPNNQASGEKVNEDTVLSTELADVIQENSIVIDFSVPEATMRNLKLAQDKNVPFIVGTTGFSEEEDEEIKRIAGNIPVVMSHNFGIGMNVFYNLVSKAAELLEDFDIEIVEFHGRDKKDAPSGTGHTIAGKIAASRGIDLEENITYGREKGISDNIRDKKTIGMHSIRGGNYKSNHTVIFAGDGETIELAHREESLSIIVNGVMKALEYIKDKEPGFYEMDDVLGTN